MSDDIGKFVMGADQPVEDMPGRTHHWICKPDMFAGTKLLTVRVTVPPGGSHKFHYHPNMEEVIMCTRGSVQQWLEQEPRTLKPGDSIYIRKGVVHATYNDSDEEAEILAILSPADAEGPAAVQVEDEAPWNTLR